MSRIFLVYLEGTLHYNKMCLYVEILLWEWIHWFEWIGLEPSGDEVNLSEFIDPSNGTKWGCTEFIGLMNRDGMNLWIGTYYITLILVYGI